MSVVPGIPEGAIDIGGGHWIKLCDYKGEVAALNDYHLRPDGTVCAGFISFRGRSWSKQFEHSPAHQAWDVISENPLHLEPSLLCRACGDHGFIRNGRWVKA
jgi:hypothetical protein